MSCGGVSVNMVLITGRGCFRASSFCASSVSFCPKQLFGLHNTRRSNICALYSQPQDISSEIQDRIKNLPKLVEDVLQTSINTGPRGVVRLAQGIQATMAVGSEWLSEVSNSANSSRDVSFGLQFGLLSPTYLRRLFERMGATYIKLGQFIASTPTLFPEDYVKEFQNCFDKAPPVPFHEIETVLQKELNQPLETVYEYIDPVPIASASIAQVHGARLRGSRKDVVIKVLKPGIEDFLIADLNFLYLVARLLEFLSPQISRTSLVGIVGDIRESMLEEVDFQKEAANLETFRGYLEATGLTRQAAAPKVYYHCSSRRVLTMERLYGVPLTDLDSIRSLVSSPEASLITALNVWFGSLLSCETFHADVHAGNLWLLNDGRIGFLDFGIVGRISPRTWTAMETFLTSIGNGQFEAMAASLVQMGATGDNVDTRSFARDLEKIFSSIQDLDSELIVAASRGPNNATVSANLAIDEQQMNALFLDVGLGLMPMPADDRSTIFSWTHQYSFLIHTSKDITLELTTWKEKLLSIEKYAINFVEHIPCRYFSDEGVNCLIHNLQNEFVQLIRERFCGNLHVAKMYLLAEITVKFDKAEKDYVDLSKTIDDASVNLQMRTVHLESITIPNEAKVDEFERNLNSQT